MDIDYELHPEAYPSEMDDEQALSIHPYAARLVPDWHYASAAEAAASAAALYAWYLRFKERGDFVGMDVTRRLLRLGQKRARALDADVITPGAGPLRPSAAAIFSKSFRMVDHDPDFMAMRAARRGGSK